MSGHFFWSHSFWHSLTSQLEKLKFSSTSEFQVKTFFQYIFSFGVLNKMSWCNFIIKSSDLFPQQMIKHLLKNYLFILLPGEKKELVWFHRKNLPRSVFHIKNENISWQICFSTQKNVLTFCKHLTDFTKRPEIQNMLLRLHWTKILTGNRSVIHCNLKTLWWLVGEYSPLWTSPWLWRVCRGRWRGCRAWRTEPDTSQSPRPTTGTRTHCCRSAACSSPGGTGRWPAERRRRRRSQNRTSSSSSVMLSLLVLGVIRSVNTQTMMSPRKHCFVRVKRLKIVFYLLCSCNY